MMVMAGSAVWIALGAGEVMNVVVGTLTFYLVVSSWLTVRRPPDSFGRVERAAMLIVLADGFGCLYYGVQVQRGVYQIVGAPAAACYVFGGVAVLAGVLDLRVMIRGGVSGAQRIARHLWRMCTALLITATSFFLARAHLFPAFVRSTISTCCRSSSCCWR